MNPLRRLPAHLLNGIGVAVGIGLIQLVIGGTAGLHAAQLALSGAVCASLADTPNTVARTLQRVAAAGALAFAAALVVAALKPHPQVLGLAVAAIAFIAMMTMAWGARAGAVSFAPILALVFSMAVPAKAGPPWLLAGWCGAGALCYLLWSLASSAMLQRRYRTLSLLQALQATAELLRARAALLTAADAKNAGAGLDASMRAWIRGEAALAERLQSARDFVFDHVGGARARMHTAILLRLIELRDVLLASRLDLDLLGADDAGRWILRQVATALGRISEGLDGAATALRDGIAPAPLAADQFDFREVFAQAPIAADDPRARLLPAITDRLRNLGADVVRIHAVLHGDEDPSPLTPEQLRRFVAAEGWPLQALRAQMSMQSPVLRHAVRAALALGSAYYLALALPWASHPHWLVLSVAVVLRGNLEQTLSRRNARVLGTMLGCVVVLMLAPVHAPALLSLVFLAAVGTAHSFVLQRYWLTATAATVMALLQSHMVDPAGGFAIAERVADTLIGAALAWAFSYVLPSWERRSLPRAVERVMKELHDYAAFALSRQPADAVEQRLARRRAYDALSALAVTLQRSTAEPAAVRVPLKEVASLLDHGQRLMAHLSMVRLMLARRGGELDRAEAQDALAAAYQALLACLGAGTADATWPEETDPEELARLPELPPAHDVLPWLTRRLGVLVRDARSARAAAQRVTASA
jgi:uncharacterized membrane protein YccC